MELSQLRYFKELARTEHLSKTADRLHITPPSLSVSISKLEQELGVQLFDRRGRTIRLNKNGELFLEYVEQTLKMLETGCKRLRDNASRSTNSLLLGVSAQTLWLQGLDAFHDSYPQISVSREQIYIPQFSDSAFLSRFDFILTDLQDLPPQEYEHCILTDDPPVLLLSKNHPLTGRREITLNEAEAEPVILLPKTHSSRKMSDALYQAAHVEPYVIAECDYLLRAQLLHTVKRAVAVTSMLGMTSSLISDLDYIPIRTTAPRRIQTLFWPKKRKLTFSQTLFKDFFCKYYMSVPRK